jgi:hypothetical protein
MCRSILLPKIEAQSSNTGIVYDEKSGKVVATPGLQVVAPWTVVLSTKYAGRYFFLNRNTNASEWLLDPTECGLPTQTTQLLLTKPQQQKSNLMMMKLQEEEEEEELEGGELIFDYSSSKQSLVECALEFNKEEPQLPRQQQAQPRPSRPKKAHSESSMFNHLLPSLLPSLFSFQHQRANTIDASLIGRRGDAAAENEEELPKHPMLTVRTGQWTRTSADTVRRKTYKRTMLYIAIFIEGSLLSPYTV